MSAIDDLINQGNRGAVPLEGRAPLTVNFSIDDRYDRIVEDGTVTDLIIEAEPSGYRIVEVP